VRILGNSITEMKAHACAYLHILVMQKHIIGGVMAGAVKG